MSVTVRDAKLNALSQGIDAIDADALLCFVLEKTRTFLYTWPEHQLDESQWTSLQVLFKKRLEGEPVAYLTGVREFWSLPIKTNPTTLIPRPDTEVLVETVLNHITSDDIRCIDLGTGTGAIALALKSEKPTWHVIGIDRIEDAVSLAKSNAQLLNFDVEFRLGHWCDGFEASSVNVIVSNPPYIDENDEHLSQGDVRFEPLSALVADEQGLADIRQITTQASKCLTAHGALFFEHGWQQAKAVRALMQEQGFNNVSTVKDYAGNERVTFGFKA